MKKLLKNKNLLCIIVSFGIEITLLLVIKLFKEYFFYSGVFSDLIYLVGILIFGIFFTAVVVKYILKKKRFFYKILLFIFSVILLIYLILFFKCINAFRYENNNELVILTEKYSLKKAKEIKKAINDIFEYDINGVSSREVTIGNFYEDGDFFVLYLDDLFGNYRLKFYLDITNGKINNVFFEFNEKCFYLVKNMEKTTDFEYYYSMYIFNNVLSGDVTGLPTIEEDIEKIIKSEFDINYISNIIFTYDELIYDSSNNKFYLDVFVHNMDYYGYMLDFSYTVEFKGDDYNKKKTWYYGDSSFDFLEFTIIKNN